MNLLFCVEASPGIGHGHVARCASLADEAARRELRAAFVPANDYTGRLLAGLGRPVAEPGREADAAFMVIDHHGHIEPGWVRSLRSGGSTVLLLDCQGPARLEADAVCDSLMVPATRARLPHADSTRYLYGLDYALLREQFRAAHAGARPGVSSRPRLCIVMGGRDQHCVTPGLVRALDARSFRGPASIVAERGDGPAGVDALRNLTAGWADTTVSCDVHAMAELMLACDLVVNKIGGTTLEAMCLGIGSVMIEPSPAHVELNAALDAAYAGWPTVELGLAEEIDMDAAAERVLAMLADGPLLRELGARGHELIDGSGCGRLVDALLTLREERACV